MKGMKKFTRTTALSLAILFMILGVSASVEADVTWDVIFYDTGYDYYQSGQYDGSGWINLNVDNQSSSAWGDFHFFLFDIGNGLTDVQFVDSGTNAPTSSQTPLTWNLSGDGLAIDLFFYSDPVAPTGNATFSVHVDNPNAVMHGVGFYPTVVPEPISSTLFLVGAGTLGFRRWRKKRTT